MAWKLFVCRLCFDIISSISGYPAVLEWRMFVTVRAPVIFSRRRFYLGPRFCENYQASLSPSLVVVEFIYPLLL